MLEDPRRLLAPEEVLAAGRGFVDGNARGATSCYPADVGLCSVPVATELAALLNGGWLAGASSTSSLTTLTGFLAKPQGGHHGIELVDALYRAPWAARRPSLAPWAEEHTPFWGDAARGSSPLRDVMCRNILLEAGARLQLAIASIRWLVEAFGCKTT